MAPRSFNTSMTTLLHSATRTTPRSTPTTFHLQRQRTLPQSLTKQTRTFLTASSSPAIESSWLTKNSRNHRGGAALAAKMSPRAQLVAAEEGLNQWLSPPPATLRTPSFEPLGTEAPRLWNDVPATEAVVGKGKLGSGSGSGVPVVKRQRTPYERVKPGDIQRDDTPGLIAFSAFLLLPLAFQLGRYFEGRDKNNTSTTNEGTVSSANAGRESVAGVDAGGFLGLSEHGLGFAGLTEMARGLVGMRQPALGTVEEVKEDGGRRGWFWAE